MPLEELGLEQRARQLEDTPTADTAPAQSITYMHIYEDNKVPMVSAANTTDDLCCCHRSR